MKNYWLNKNDEKNKEIEETPVMRGEIQEASSYTKNRPYCWRTPVVEELPKGDKTPVMQIKVCPSTGVKHNFSSVSYFEIGDERKAFNPYSISLIEAARRAYHQIKLMNDAMFMHKLSEVLKEKQDSSDIGK